MPHASGLLRAVLLGAPAPRPTLNQLRAGLTSRTVRLGQEDDEHAVWLRVGDTLEVSLPGQPSAGCTWLLSEPPSPVLVPLGEADTLAALGLLGACGQVVLRYRVAAAGTRRLSLAERRPFDLPNPSARTFMVTVMAR